MASRITCSSPRIPNPSQDQSMENPATAAAAATAAIVLGSCQSVVLTCQASLWNLAPPEPARICTSQSGVAWWAAAHTTCRADQYPCSSGHHHQPGESQATLETTWRCASLHAWLMLLQAVQPRLGQKSESFTDRDTAYSLKSYKTKQAVKNSMQEPSLRCCPSWQLWEQQQPSLLNLSVYS